MGRAELLSGVRCDSHCSRSRRLLALEVSSPLAPNAIPHTRLVFHLSLSVVLPPLSWAPHWPRQAVHGQGINQFNEPAHLHFQHPPWHDRSHWRLNTFSPRICRKDARALARTAAGNCAAIGRHSFSAQSASGPVRSTRPAFRGRAKGIATGEPNWRGPRSAPP